LVGDFAWLITSDGRATVVNIFDGCPAPNQPSQLTTAGPFAGPCDPSYIAQAIKETQIQVGHPEALLLERLSHRLRPGHPRFALPRAASDPTGQPRVIDESNPVLVSVPATSLGDGGVSDGGVTAGLPGLYAENVPAALTTVPPGVIGDTIPTRVIRFPDP